MDAVFDELASRFVTEDTFSDYMKMGLPITKDQFKNLKSFLETLDDDPLYASSILPEIREFFSILTIRYNQRGIKNGKH